jgi:carbonic anhydrase
VRLPVAKGHHLHRLAAANVRWSVQQFADRPAVKQALREGRILLVGTVYELATGNVRFLEL